ncbi:MAG: Wzz/FepE/Etk N-terminal domain-containing protein [Gammaproteobacteria bacterium]|nr:Wzz/FepE/Etk N-terminal domain-containing protein [Gammaproteobacteria bacterium]
MTVTEQTEISLLDVIDVFWRRRWLMGGVIILTFALALAVAFIMTPMYRATVVMVPVEMGEGQSALGGLVGQLGGLASLAGVAMNDGAEAEEAIATLTSRFFTTKFIVERNLMPVLFASLWDADKQTWIVDKPDEIPSLTDGFMLMDSSVRSVVRDRDTGLLSLQIDWEDSAVAAAWANQMVEMINLHLRELAIAEAENSISYLNLELEKTSVVGTRNAIYSLMETQIQSIMLANVRKEYAFKIIDPAVVLEADDFFRPDRPVLAILGLAVGMALSVFIALGMAFVEKLR